MSDAPNTLPRPTLRRWAGLWDLWELMKTAFMMAAIYALVELATPRFYVEGRSMQPNFADGQRLIVSRVNYLFTDPQRGDIIVFNSPQGGRTQPPLIKRVIGLPGESVTIQDTQVYVNGVELDEPYIKEPCSLSNCKDERVELGPNDYFVMGDNRNNSNDSRRFGPVHRDAIIGEALIRYWPPPDWGIVAQIGVQK